MFSHFNKTELNSVDCFLLPLQEFIEEILSPPFGGMIAFVKEAEALMEKGQLERLKNEEGEKSLFSSGLILNEKVMRSGSKREAG